LVDLIKCCTITKIFNDDEFETKNREHLDWIDNNNSILVFCGDLIHRKRFDHVLDDECSDIYIINLLLRLKEESKKNNGDVIIISGNHEIMNIIKPNDVSYVSNKNIKKNKEYFNNKNFVNKYVKNSYAWIKINNILLAHGGLCSDYLKYLDKYKNFNNNINIDNLNDNLKGSKIIDFINDKYQDFFVNFDIKKVNKDSLEYNLFIEYDLINKSKHNIFWCTVRDTAAWQLGSSTCLLTPRMWRAWRCSSYPDLTKPVAGPWP
jgi:hypothetical protein